MNEGQTVGSFEPRGSLPSDAELGPSLLVGTHLDLTEAAGRELV